MEKRKGLGNSAFALLTSVSLITGLTLLSMSGNPYDIVGNSTETGNNSPQIDNVSLPENTSINASNYVNSEDTRKAVEQQDLITNISRKLFELVSGKQLSNSQGNFTPEGNFSLPENTTNFTDNSTASINRTGNSTDFNETAPKNTKNKTSDNHSLLNNTSDFNDSISNNNSLNTSSDGFNQSPSIGNNTEKSLGMLAKLAKTMSQLFGGETGESSPNMNETANQTPSENMTRNDSSSQPEQQKPQQPDQENKSQSSTEESTENKQKESSSILNKLMPITGLIASLALIVVYLRSDMDGKEFLKTIAAKLRNGITSIPDLFRRTIVNTISFAVEKTSTLLLLAKKIVKTPKQTIQKLNKKIEYCLSWLKKSLDAMKSRSIQENMKLLLTGKEESYDGIDKVWYNLKKTLKIENKHAITPAEIRAEAIRQNMPEKTVNEIVEAFRREKYSSKGYPDELDLSKLDKEITGDEH